MRPRNIIPRESVYTQRADYLGVTNSLSWEELWWWKGRTNGEGFRGENTRIFSVVAVSPAILVPFFFSPFFFPFRKLLQSKKRLVAARNDDGRSRIETSFSRVKIKLPCLCAGAAIIVVFRGGRKI